MNKREYAKLKKPRKCMSAVTISQTYSRERSMKGGCRDEALCSKGFARKEELSYGKNTRKRRDDL